MVDAAVPVREEEVIEAMRLCYERMKVVVEPSAGVGLAAVLSKEFSLDGPHSKDTEVEMEAEGAGNSAADSTSENGIQNEPENAQPPLHVGVILCGGNIDLTDFFNTLKPPSVDATGVEK